MTLSRYPEPHRPESAPSGDGGTTSGQRLSMHAGVEVWEDCCSCEAEPYWLEAIATDQPEPADN